MAVETSAMVLQVAVNNQARATLDVRPKLPGDFHGYDAVVVSARQTYGTGLPVPKGLDFTAIADFGAPNVPGKPTLPSPDFRLTVQSLTGLNWTGTVYVDCILRYSTT